MPWCRQRRAPLWLSTPSPRFSPQRLMIFAHLWWSLLILASITYQSLEINYSFLLVAELCACNGPTASRDASEERDERMCWDYKRQWSTKITSIHPIVEKTHAGYSWFMSAGSHVDSNQWRSGELTNWEWQDRAGHQNNKPAACRQGCPNGTSL